MNKKSLEGIPGGEPNTITLYVCNFSITYCHHKLLLYLKPFLWKQFEYNSKKVSMNYNVNIAQPRKLSLNELFSRVIFIFLYTKTQILPTTINLDGVYGYKMLSILFNDPFYLEYEKKPCKSCIHISTINHTSMHGSLSIFWPVHLTEKSR